MFSHSAISLMVLLMYLLMCHFFGTNMRMRPLCRISLLDSQDLYRLTGRLQVFLVPLTLRSSSLASRIMSDRLRIRCLGRLHTCGSDRYFLKGLRNCLDPYPRSQTTGGHQATKTNTSRPFGTGPCISIHLFRHLTHRRVPYVG